MESIMCSNRSREVYREHCEHHNSALALIEDRNFDIFKLLDLLEQMRQNWSYEKTRAQRTAEELLEKDKETDELQREVRIFKERLRDARAQIATLISCKKELEHDITELERKLQLVNDILKDQSILSDRDRQKIFSRSGTFSRNILTKRQTSNTHLGISHPSSEGEDIDYDKTNETMDISFEDPEESRLRNGKVYRRSHSMVSLSGKRASSTLVKRPKKNIEMDVVNEEETVTSCKRRNDGSSALITTTATVTIDPEGKKPSEAKFAVKRSMNRSLSEASILNHAEEAVPLTAKTPQFDCCTIDSKTWTHGASIETRPHTYVNHNSILGDHCGVCKGWIGIVGKQAYKCCDCGIHIHKTCIDNAPVPCVPRTPTPRTPGKHRPRLKDFCPSTHPMIPSLLIHCILALEKNHLNSEGIYRIPGDYNKVQKLLDDFQNSRTVPKLEYHDTETITSCIKQFLNKLRDPVIPTTSWEEFVNAAEADDIEALNQWVMDLPYPNRDTLAFLCAHFQKVCDNSFVNKMPPNVLARCTAAMIIGPSPSRTLKSDEEALQVKVMLAFLKMPRDYWPKFYNYGSVVPLIKTPVCSSQNNGTPIRSACKNPNQSILGPIETPPFGQELKTFQPKLPKRKHFLGDIF